MNGKNCHTCRKCFHCLSSLELLTEGRKMTQKDIDYNCELWGGYEREVK